MNKSLMIPAALVLSVVPLSIANTSDAATYKWNNTKNVAVFNKDLKVKWCSAGTVGTVSPGEKTSKDV